MKRSEMIEILEEAIHNNYDYAVDTGPTYSYDDILRELEKAGMLPPKTQLEKINVRKNMITYPTVREWEPEEE